MPYGPPGSLFGPIKKPPVLPKPAPALGYNLGPDNLGQTFPGLLPIPGITPNYSSSIANDPSLGLLRKFGAEESGIEAGRMADLIDRLNQRLGTGISQIGSKYRDLGQQSIGDLTGRGFYDSGQVGFAQGKLNEAQTGETNDLRTQIQDAIKQARQNFEDAQRQRAQQLEAQTLQAKQQAAAANPSTPAMTASLLSGWVAQGGGPVYRTPDGRYFDRNGQPTVPRMA